MALCLLAFIGMGRQVQLYSFSPSSLLLSPLLSSYYYSFSLCFCFLRCWFLTQSLIRFYHHHLVNILQPLQSASTSDLSTVKPKLRICHLCKNMQKAVQGTTCHLLAFIEIC